MPCLLGCLSLMFPRLVIVILALFSEYMDYAYDRLIWPILGFIFMPYTTLAYAWAINSRGSVSGLFIVVMVIAVLADLGSYGHSGHSATRVRRR